MPISITLQPVDIIPEEKIGDNDYIESVLESNRRYSIENREEIIEIIEYIIEKREERIEKREERRDRQARPR